MLIVSSTCMSTVIYFGVTQEKHLIKDEHTLSKWLNLHCKLVKKATGISHVAYSRHFSYTAIAAYESVVPGYSSFYSLSGQLPEYNFQPLPLKKNFNCDISLNAAYATMLKFFYGSFGTCAASIDSLEVSIYEAFSQADDQASIEESSLFGQTVAKAVIAWSKTDGSDSKKIYKPVRAEGTWVPAIKPAAPFWSECRSMSPNLQKAFVLDKPVYSSNKASSFYRMAQEVYNITTHLTPDQKATALYWDDSPNGAYLTVFGHWTSILSGLIKENEISLVKSLTAYVQMAIAMHDASILAWKGKYTFNVLRPVTYIQQHIDKNWQPLIETPPHPEFPAAHATLSTAAATALTTVFGDKCKVVDRSYETIGMPARTYPTILEAANEAGMSRLYGGIHYRYSIEQGNMLGSLVAKHVIQKFKLHR